MPCTPTKEPWSPPAVNVIECADDLDAYLERAVTDEQRHRLQQIQSLMREGEHERPAPRAARR